MASCHDWTIGLPTFYTTLCASLPPTGWSVCAAFFFLFFFFLLYLINHSQRVEAPALVHTLRLYKGHTHVHTGTVCKLIPAVSFTRDRGAKHQVVPGR